MNKTEQSGLFPLLAYITAGMAEYRGIRCFVNIMRYNSAILKICINFKPKLYCGSNKAIAENTFQNVQPVK